jgi:O-6-methylguanine DNA methyltransferase
MQKPILNRAVLDTPYGKMEAMATDKGLSILEFIKPDRRQLMLRRLARWFPGCEVTDRRTPVIVRTEAWLADYFQGRFEQLTPPPLDLRGTDFELKVWQALRRIPCGRTQSYKELALELGLPGGARAVGGANRRNPVSLIVPCHRVIGQTGALTGYGGGIEVKQALITHERSG